ncbi:hypothetical protein ACS0TY_023646 [Phlomoides rotata]
MGRNKPTTRDEENAPVGGARGGKSKKKGFTITDDEYLIGTELSEEAVVPEEKAAPVGTKKGKKGGKKNEPKDEDYEVVDNVEREEEEEPVITFGGKKKTKGKKSGSSSMFSSSNFGLLEDEDEELDVPVIAFSGKKKPSKSKKSGGSFPSAFDLLGEDEESRDKDESSKEEDEDAEITFTGKKKKSSKGLKKPSGNSSSFTFPDEDESVSKDEDDLAECGSDDQEADASAVKFSGKKKSSKKKNTSADTVLEAANGDTSSNLVEPHQHPDTSKSKKKKKKGAKTLQEEDDLDQILAELGAAPPVPTRVPTSVAPPVQDEPEPEEAEGVDTSKNKKKKKKGGKPRQEEEDLDQILAEIGAAPPVPGNVPTSIAPLEVKVDQPGQEEAADDKEGEEGITESVTSKKKKKKKEKEKEKKGVASASAAEEKQEETNNKVPGRKVPKHVREMQELLAKQKEAEEKRKREEEEKLRKEEEEMRKQEEQERLAEEKKRLKKEKEKEKLLKKKQEGKLLTGKQKEEARKLEAFRKQLLANGSLPSTAGETSGASAKRPLYQKKKSKPQTQSNGAVISDSVNSTDSKEIPQQIVVELDSGEPENVEELEFGSTKDKTEIADIVEENRVDEVEEEDDDDEEWDAKSWDEADLKLPGKSAFSDVEVDSDPEPLLKKEAKNARPVPQDVELPSAKSVLQNADVTKRNSAAEGDDQKINKKNKKVNAVEETSKADDHSVQIEQNLRSPICCIMGHVDTGKTKLLDCVRGTNVQEGEAGGITQQIGATYIPTENIRDRTKELKADAKLDVPGLLVIDTPGHESFNNLRSRGSGLCDIAILVVDIMHGLEPQTIESLNLLRMRNTEFIIALNKVDRLYGWKTERNAPIGKALKQQSKDVISEFNKRVTDVITEFMEQGVNTELYNKNKDRGEYFSIVPTSAVSGEGIPELLLLLVQWAQKMMIKRLTYSEKVQCTVLEVKVIEGHGTTIDVILVNGVLHEGDQIVVCGLQGPIVTSIRALLTPHPMRELRVKGTYLHYKEIKAAQGIKITAQGLEHAIAGASLYVVGPHDDLEEIKESAMEDMKSMMSRIDKSGEGVYVQASTLGSLEALLEFLKTPAVNIPVSGISIGPVHKKDVMKASVMLEKKKEYGTILAFDVKVTPEARELADELGVKIFIADIIYHLFDQFKAYIHNLKEERKKEAAEEAVFPCVLKIMPNCVFNKKDPIVLGVDVLDGILKVGTPICIPQREFIEIGRIASIENNHKPVDDAKKGQKVAIKIISNSSEEQQKMFGRHFEIEDELVSKISRHSLDALKENYADDLSTEEKRLLFKLKKLFKIP